MSRSLFRFFGHLRTSTLLFYDATRPFFAADPTFACTGPSGTRPGICSIYYTVSIFNNSVKGIRAFRRSDNSIQFLVHNAGASGKTPPINSMSVLIIPPDAGSYTRTQGPNNIVALDAAMRPEETWRRSETGVPRISLSNGSPGRAGRHRYLNFGQNVDRAANVITQPAARSSLPAFHPMGGKFNSTGANES